MASLPSSPRVLRVLIYSANFAPEPTGIGKYSGEMAAWLAARGHEVRVVCAPPYYPHWHVPEAYRRPLWRHEAWQGIGVWRAPLWVPRQPGGLARVLHLCSFALSSLPVVLRQAAWRPHVVFTVAPFLTCAPAGWLAARLSGATAWLHVQDFELEVAFGMGLLKGGTVRRVVLAAEGWLLRRFDRVSSISRGMVQRLRDKRVEVGRAVLFPNWVDTDSIVPWTGGNRYRQALGLRPGATVALFSGTLGRKQSLPTIVEAARLTAGHGDLVYVICGDGVMKPEIESAAAGLPNLHLLPLQPAERLSELLGLADIHLLTQSVDAEDLLLPSKLSGMLASGRPVVATCRAGTQVAEALEGCGVLAAPGDAAALAASVVALAGDAPRRQQLGRRGRERAQAEFGRDAVLGAWLATQGAAT